MFYRCFVNKLLTFCQQEAVKKGRFYILWKKIMFFWLKLVTMWENVGNMFHICAINLRPRR